MARPIGSYPECGVSGRADAVLIHFFWCRCRVLKLCLLLRIEGDIHLLTSPNAFTIISFLQSLAGRLAYSVRLQNGSHNCRLLLATNGQVTLPMTEFVLMSRCLASCVSNGWWYTQQICTIICRDLGECDLRSICTEIFGALSR